MTTILLILTASNMLMAYLNYNKENYKTAMFSTFAAGFCASTAISIFFY